MQLMTQGTYTPVAQVVGWFVVQWDHCADGQLIVKRIAQELQAMVNEGKAREAAGVPSRVHAQVTSLGHVVRVSFHDNEDASKSVQDFDYLQRLRVRWSERRLVSACEELGLRKDGIVAVTKDPVTAYLYAMKEYGRSDITREHVERHKIIGGNGQVIEQGGTVYCWRGGRLMRGRVWGGIGGTCIFIYSQCTYSAGAAIARVHPRELLEKPTGPYPRGRHFPLDVREACLRDAIDQWQDKGKFERADRATLALQKMLRESDRTKGTR